MFKPQNISVKIFRGPPRNSRVWTGLVRVGQGLVFPGSDWWERGRGEGLGGGGGGGVASNSWLHCWFVRMSALDFRLFVNA